MDKFKFSETATPKPPDIFAKMTPTDFLKSKYDSGCIFGRDQLCNYGTYKLMGWEFDFRPYLKQYVIEQYGTLSKVWAPNRTNLRKAIYGKINILCEL